MKTSLKILSLFLVVAMLVSALDLYVFAGDNTLAPRPVTTGEDDVDKEDDELPIIWIDEEGQKYYYGDANGDKEVDMNDIVLLRQYIANYDYDTNTSTVEVKPGADANGDKTVDMNDIVLLRQYIANYDYDTKTSTIALGPQFKAKISDAQLNEMLETVRKQYSAVSMTAAVIENGVVATKGASGWAELNVKEMEYDSKVWVGSLTKIVLGAATMKMVEEGIIKLDDDISDYWGVEIKNLYNNKPVTIRHLLTHTSTLKSLGTKHGYDAIKDLLLTKSSWDNKTPGSEEAWLYNNFGYTVLGGTLDLALKGSLETYLQTKFFKPLGMDSSFDASTLAHPEKVANMYKSDGSMGRSAEAQIAQTHSLDPVASAGHYYGGLVSSSYDLAKFYRILILGGTVDGVQYLKPESVQLMETEYCKVASRTTQHQCVGGLRDQTNIYSISKCFFHTGSGMGVHNLMIYDPATKNGIVIFSVGCNDDTSTYGIYNATNELAKQVFTALNAK